MKTTSSIITALMLGAAEAGPSATKYSMDAAQKSTGAMCLDGSPGAYYHLPGTGTGANKWYAHARTRACTRLLCLTCDAPP
jgi:hypothetical protein